ncbi:MFS transporter [Thermoactinospora rubra]|uniref:MFS transporter n=1 Tax=Thermoactinospora rubra TaxID=1088767 RepID=UPI000A1225B2|nr:MFS transporter [Thermoactinospora rubra]
MAVSAVLPEVPRKTRGPWPMVVTLAFSASTAALQTSAVLPMLGILQHDLRVSILAASWTLTISLLVGAVATPLLSRFGDMYGRRRVILAALLLLVAGSVMGALAGSLAWLIAARVLQGFSAALVPLSIGVAREVLPRNQLPTGIGVLSATMGIGSGAGMILAGLVGGDFRAVFWTIGAVGLIATVLVAVLVDSSVPEVKGRPDLLGAALLTTALIALLLAVTQGRAWGWTSPAVLSLVAVAAAGLATWTAVERRAPEPLVELPMLTHRGTVGASISSALLGFAFFGFFTGLASYARARFAASTLEVGLYLVPATVFMLVLSLYAGRLTRRFSASSLVGTGSAVVALGLVWLIVSHDHPADLYVASSLLGLGLGIGYAALGTMAVEHVDPAKTAVAAGVNALVRVVGGAVAGAVVAAILAARPDVAGYEWTFAVCAVAGLVGAVVAFAFGRLNRRPATAPAGR